MKTLSLEEEEDGLETNEFCLVRWNTLLRLLIHIPSSQHALRRWAC